MDFVDKARVRLERWITHNDDHQSEYQTFADQLEGAGKKESAKYIREMIQLSAKSNDCLRRALEALKND
jgi:hypothetical protein